MKVYENRILHTCLLVDVMKFSRLTSKICTHLVKTLLEKVIILFHITLAGLLVTKMWPGGKSSCSEKGAVFDQ
jgi:hypothetical protein